ncbi:hypothetical protein SAMN05660662_0481 [Blastococcus aurantiacus]|uniref:Uncharacterized protein n=2 Tax=Blastococcus aurantiacus TaxID=1550231 RepID=A0A1G7HAT0_9ACTN|nr:hypothetical protein SAMN05660662_0481 [Blastococcus aurantiacus]
MIATVPGYRAPMDAVSLGKAGLQGWRAKVADAVAGPVAQRSPFTDEQVRAAVGAAFFVLSVVYVVQAVRQLQRT